MARGGGGGGAAGRRAARGRDSRASVRRAHAQPPARALGLREQLAAGALAELCAAPRRCRRRPRHGRRRDDGPQERVPLR